MRIKRRGLDVDPNKRETSTASVDMVLSLSFLLSIGLLAILTTTADSAQPNHEWQAYGNTIVDHLGRLKRQLPEGGGGKCMASMVRYHNYIRVCRSRISYPVRTLHNL